MSYFAKSVLCSVLVFAAIVAIACCALAQTAPVVGSMVIRGPAAMLSGVCSVTDTSFARDLLIEGFASPPTNTWTTVGAGGYLTFGDDTSLLSAGKVAGICDTSLSVNTTGNTGAVTYVRADLGSTIDLDSQSVILRVAIYVTSPFDTSAEAFTILALTPTTTMSTSAIGSVVLNFDGTNMEARVSGTYVDLVANSWNIFTWYLDTQTTGNLSYFQVNSNTPQFFNRGANDLRYVHVGACNGIGVGEDVTFKIDLLCID